MLSTKNIVTDYKEIPQTFIFEYYCQLKEKLKGQDVRISSVFNSKDNDPSMFIYYDKQKEAYKFKDFSTGYYGSEIDLVKLMKNVTFAQAISIIVRDYNDYVLKHGTAYITAEYEEHSKFQVTNYSTRSWTTNDRDQWVPYNIGSSLLQKYHVIPLEFYEMSKEENGSVHSFRITGDFIYGYFTKEGELYKIYQPKNRERKFIKVRNFIQGSDQLGKHDYLVITSSLKDIMAIESMELKVDLVAPDSENSMIPEDDMKRYLKQYKRVIVLFDNDDAGIKAMKKYRDIYQTPLILLTLDKDPSDAVKNHGVSRVKEQLVPLINSRIC